MTPARPSLRRRFGRWGTALLACGTLACGTLASSVVLCAGCVSETEQDLRRQITALKDQVRTKDNQLVAQQVTIDTLNERLNVVRALTPEQLKFIYFPEQIKLLGITGGADYDGQPGDDGVNVYIQPVDRDGDVVKVAGSIRVDLFDLQNAPNPTQLGHWEIAPADTHALWFGDLWTNCYVLKCPLPTRPAHREITVQVVFTDYLTQRVMTAVTTCEYHFPPGTPPTASQPVTAAPPP